MLEFRHTLLKRNDAGDLCIVSRRRFNSHGETSPAIIATFTRNANALPRRAA